MRTARSADGNVMSIIAPHATANAATTTTTHGASIGEPGSVMSLGFELAGQEFMALNGGPDFRFNPSISFYVHCEDQAEIDRLWNALLDGGEPQQCGWITDRFGVTWQIVPDILETFLTDEDQAKVQRVTEAFLQMEKFDIPALEAAYAG